MPIDDVNFKFCFGTEPETYESLVAKYGAEQVFETMSDFFNNSTPEQREKPCYVADATKPIKGDWSFQDPPALEFDSYLEIPGDGG